MSDIKSANDKHLQALVESIAQKISSSTALNGGFDKMLMMVEHIQEKQSDTSEKVDKIHDALYNPSEGLYARIKMVENASLQSKTNHTEIKQAIEKLVESDDHLVKKIETTEKLKKIAGEDLEKLDAVIKVKSAWSEWSGKGLWLIIGGVFAAFGKSIWDVIGHR